jgi:hypothetical protein
MFERAFQDRRSRLCASEPYDALRSFVPSRGGRGALDVVFEIAQVNRARTVGGCIHNLRRRMMTLLQDSFAGSLSVPTRHSEEFRQPIRRNMLAVINVACGSKCEILAKSRYFLLCLQQQTSLSRVSRSVRCQQQTWTRLCDYPVGAVHAVSRANLRLASIQRRGHLNHN